MGNKHSSKSHQTYCEKCEAREYRKTKPITGYGFRVRRACNHCLQPSVLWIPPASPLDAPMGKYHKDK